MMTEKDIHGAYVYRLGKLYGRLAVHRPYIFLCTNDRGFRGTEIDDRFGFAYSYSFYPSGIRDLSRAIEYCKNNYGLKVVLTDSVTLYDLI